MITLNPGTNRIEVSLNLTSVPPPGITPQADVRVDPERGIYVEPSPCYFGAILYLMVHLHNYGTVEGTGSASGMFGLVPLEKQQLTLVPGDLGQVGWTVRTYNFSPGVYNVSIDGLSTSVEILPVPVVTGAVQGTIFLDGIPTASIGLGIPEVGKVASSDANGHYEITGLPPGQITLDVYSYSGHPEIGGIIPQLRLVTIIAGQTRTEDFYIKSIPKRTGTVYGYLIDAKTKAPITFISSYFYFNITLVASNGQILKTYTFGGDFYINKVPESYAQITIENISTNTLVAPRRYVTETFEVYVRPSGYGENEFTFELRRI